VADSGKGSGAVSVRRARPDEAERLADIQEQTITWGELRNLGHRFLVVLHHHLITSPDGICYVVEKDGAVVGYSAWTYDTRKLYADFKRRYFVRAALAVLPRLLNPRNWRPLLRGMTYTNVAQPGDPVAEMLFFSILPEGRHGGVGSLIFNTMLDEMRRHGVTSIKAATVTPDNTPAVKFYERNNFRKLRTDGFYADTQVDVYVLDLT